MHVGHVRNYTIGDVMARYARMQGYNVLHPMGWDAFGLPAENYAIKNKISPKIAIEQNTTRFKHQLQQMGFSYDWTREINSTDPRFYRWTQWFFLLLFKKGLAYQKESLQWWCPFDKTVLANEQVENGRCWRCGNTVEKKALKQWFFKITDYADRLLEDLDDLDWPEAIKSMQRNWIGRSTGAEIKFAIVDHDTSINVFTTRPDTIFGVTFLVVAPEHPLLKTITTKAHAVRVDEYIKTSQAKSDIERQETTRKKTGVFTGSYAINPINNEIIPIWTADYVLMGYGTGAIMAVPSHDDRDYEFAEKFGLPKRPVIVSPDDTIENPTSPQNTPTLSSEGLMINSGKYNGLASAVARDNIVSDLEKQKAGKLRVNYKIRDWLISRQRYWGAPIPIVHCEKDGAVAVNEDQLPVLLPEIENYEPSGEGRSPLAKVPDFVNTSCPLCGGPAQRETDTMDGFACSSWYFLRFADPHNDSKPFDERLAEQWLPVDDYIGGAEHAVMHLLYARFWTKVMFDEGLIKFEEPFSALRNQGMILAPDGQKMSKSKGNTIEPDNLIGQGYGADSIRIMELFIGPWNQAANWSVDGMGGAFRFLQRTWVLVQEFIESKTNKPDAGRITDSQVMLRTVHSTIKKVTDDIESLSFNTAIAAQMELINGLYKQKAKDRFSDQQIWEYAITTAVKLLAPFAPHISEELWHMLGNNSFVNQSEWPKYDPAYLLPEKVTIAVQINGKLRDVIEVKPGSVQSEVESMALSSDVVKKLVGDQKIKKTIFIPDKLINFVI